MLQVSVQCSRIYRVSAIQVHRQFNAAYCAKRATLFALNFYYFSVIL